MTALLELGALIDSGCACLLESSAKIKHRKNEGFFRQFCTSEARQRHVFAILIGFCSCRAPNTVGNSEAPVTGELSSELGSIPDSAIGLNGRTSFRAGSR